jgi:hypothetical protein
MESMGHQNEELPVDNSWLKVAIITVVVWHNTRFGGRVK